jgi:5-hydroxyisourate hydrolase
MAHTISTHVLDTVLGVPAAGIAVTLERRAEGGWEECGGGVTDADGRIGDLLGGASLTPGVYRATFDVGGYFDSMERERFYPFVSVVFEIPSTARHYHVPLLLSPFGYTTYRGS